MTVNDSGPLGSYIVSDALTNYILGNEGRLHLLFVRLIKAKQTADFKRYTCRHKAPRSISARIERRIPIRRRLSKRPVYHDVTVRQQIGSPKLLLRYLGEKFHYVEMASGGATLTLFGEALPESICAGISGRHLRLSDIVDSKKFYTSGDPIVTKVENGSRVGRRGLTLRLQLAFKPMRRSGEQ